MRVLVFVLMVGWRSGGTLIMLVEAIAAPFVRMPNRRRRHPRAHKRGGQQQRQQCSK